MIENIVCMVINLPERTDRLENFKRIFNTYFADNKLIIIEAEKHTRPQQGCNLSHKKAIKKAIELGLKNVLIFEDDFQFITEKSIDYFKEAFENLPSDFDVALFGYYYLTEKIKVNEYWNSVSDFCALHCFLVKNLGYEKILMLPDTTHIDRLMGQKKYGIKKIATNFLCTKQTNNFSDISNKITSYDNVLQKFKQV